MYETTALPVPLNLDTPTIPTALENGTLPIEFHHRPVTVTFRVWQGSMPGYIYQLRWNGMEVGPQKTILDQENPGDPLTLEIPVALLTEGIHRVSYLVKNPWSLIENYSENTPLIIDRTPPGKPALGPILFPDLISDGLTSEELERLGNVLQGTVASYNGMQANDAVRTYWNGTPGPIAIVSEDDMGLKRVVVDFIRPFLESVGDGDAVVHYTITDLAGNVSTDSIPTPVALKLSYLPPLPTPTVKEAQGDVLDPTHATSGATVRIEALAQLRTGDRVTVQWQGPKGSDNQEKVITEADAGQALELVFAYALVIANAGETVAIAYTVNRANGQVQTSDTLHLKIRASLGSLPAPGMDTVGADGVVVPSRIPESGATVRVRYAGMSREDRVIVSWRGASNHDTKDQTVGNNAELLFNLPKALIVASSGRSATVFYNVLRADQQVQSAPLWLSVYQGLILDTTPVTLSGKVYLLPGSPDLLPTLPADTTVQRVARGGQAPYTYSSSDTLVAKVDGNGLVTVRGRGTASIQVSDSLGETLSYTVNVTGVIHCLGLGSGSFTTVSNAATQQGARLCSLDELREINAGYGNRWPMGNAYYWSSTVAKSNLAGWKWYFVKNLVTGAESKILHHNTYLGVAIR